MNKMRGFEVTLKVYVPTEDANEMSAAIGQWIDNATLQVSGGYVNIDWYDTDRVDFVMDGTEIAEIV